MELVVRAFSITEAKMEDLQAFARELLERRRRDTDHLYRQFGIESESWHVHRAPSGPVVVITTWIKDLDSSPRALAASRDPFHVWFKQQLLRLSGVDPSREPLGAPRHLVFDWRDSSAQRSPAAKAKAKAPRGQAKARVKSAKRR